MTPNHKPLIALVAAGVLLGSVAGAQSVLFQDSFNSYSVDPLNPAPPTTIAEGGKWTDVITGASPGTPVAVVLDSDNAFGRGTTNQILRIQNAVNFGLVADRLFSSQVVTFSFDLIMDPVTDPQDLTQFINTNQLFAGDGTIANANRAHLVSPRINESEQVDGRFHGISSSSDGYFTVGQLHRVDVVVNLSDSEISYNGVTLASGGVDSWVDENLIHANAVFARGANVVVPGDIQSLRMGTFSNNVFSGRFDGVTIFDGAHIGAPIPEPKTYAAIMAGLALAVVVFLRRRRIR